MMGAVWMVPRSPVSNCQATLRRLTLARLIWVRGVERSAAGRQALMGLSVFLGVWGLVWMGKKVSAARAVMQDRVGVLRVCFTCWAPLSFRLDFSGGPSYRREGIKRNGYGKGNG